MNQDTLIDFDNIDGNSSAVLLGDTQMTYARFASDIHVMQARLRSADQGQRLRLGLLVEDPYWRWVLHLAAIRTGHAVLTLRKDRCAIEAQAAMIDLIVADHVLEVAGVARHLEINVATHAQLAQQWPEFSNIEKQENNERAATRIVFTSGTTGRAKWVEWSFESMRSRIHLDGAYLEFNSGTRMYCPQAIHTTNGFRYPIATWRLGGCVILRDMNKPVETALFKSNFIRAAPSTFASLLKAAPDAWPGSLNRHVALGGARLAKAVMDDALARACSRITISCGSSEAGSIAKGDSSLLLRNPRCAGYILPDVEVEVVDAHDAPQRNGIAGALRIKTPYMVHSYGNEANGGGDVFRDGWFYPGDSAIIQDDGLLIMLGRSNHTINVNGQKFSTERIDAELENLPGLVEHCLVSLPYASGDRLGVVIVADRKIDAQEVRDIIQRYPEAAKILPLVIQVAEIPKNDMGKISRSDVTIFIMRQMAESKNSAAATRAKGA